MEITEVKVYPVEEDKLKAFATIVFDECFIVKDLKVIRGNTGLFVAMPNKKRNGGTRLTSSSYSPRVIKKAPALSARNFARTGGRQPNRANASSTITTWCRM